MLLDVFFFLRFSFLVKRDGITSSSSLFTKSEHTSDESSSAAQTIEDTSADDCCPYPKDMLRFLDDSSWDSQVRSPIVTLERRPPLFLGENREMDLVLCSDLVLSSSSDLSSTCIIPPRVFGEKRGMERVPCSDLVLSSSADFSFFEDFLPPRFFLRCENIELDRVPCSDFTLSSSSDLLRLRPPKRRPFFSSPSDKESRTSSALMCFLFLLLRNLPLAALSFIPSSSAAKTEVDSRIIVLMRSFPDGCLNIEGAEGSSLLDSEPSSRLVWSPSSSGKMSKLSKLVVLALPRTLRL